MPKVCILHGCKSSTKMAGVRFHRIPWKDKIRAKRWVEFLVSNGTRLSRINSNSRLCFKHFKEKERDPSVPSLADDAMEETSQEEQGECRNGADTVCCDNSSSGNFKRIKLEDGLEEEKYIPMVEDQKAADFSSGPNSEVNGQDSTVSKSDFLGGTVPQDDASDGLAMSLPFQESADTSCLHAGKKRRNRGPRPHWDYTMMRDMAVFGLKDSPTVESAKMKTEQRRLSFYNPGGKVVEQFDANTSVREQRKRSRRLVSTGRVKNWLYDETGRLVENGQDMCDCLDVDCPGCHFPCKRCGSEKCGAECRSHRRWVYDSISVEGKAVCFQWPWPREDSKGLVQ